MICLSNTPFTRSLVTGALISWLVTLLKTSCNKYSVTQNTRFYNRVKTDLSNLRVKFVERFEFLKTACELFDVEEYIPVSNFKENGYLQIFMELTPERSRKPFRMELPDRFTDINNFMEKFFAIVDRVSDLSEASRQYESKTGWNLKTYVSE